LTLTSSLRRCTRFSDETEGKDFSYILEGLRLLGLRSIESIFLSNILFSFYISINLFMTTLGFPFLPGCKCAYDLGALLSNILLTLLNRYICISCSYIREILSVCGCESDCIIAYLYFLLFIEYSVSHEIVLIHFLIYKILTKQLIYII
jgi:hypothetical protein